MNPTVCDCSNTETLYTDCGNYYLVQVVCKDCGSIIYSYKEDKD